MKTRFVLLPSPLLSPAAWKPVETELRGSGEVVTTLTLRGPIRSPLDVLEGFRSLLPDEPLVLVPHSNAGLFVPALAARHSVSAMVFVDAALPPVDAQMTTPAPGEVYDFLAQKADGNGILPVWTKWWEEDEVGDLFPDAATRARVEEQQQRLPLTYFAEPLPVPSDWAAKPCAYLAFGDTYADETRAAREWGWPVSVIAGGHLEILWHPAHVAREIQRLVDQLHSDNDG